MIEVMKKVNLYFVYLFLIIVTSSCTFLSELIYSDDSFHTDDQNEIEKTSSKNPLNTPIYQMFDCILEKSDFETGRAIKVIDGDSIEVDIGGEIVEVRYIGVNSPEYYSDNRNEAILASKANEKMVFGEEVYLFTDVSEADKFDRKLRYVFTSEIFVNLELVKNGYAESKSYPPDTACQNLFNEYDN